MPLCSTTIHLLPSARHHLKCSRRLSMTLTDRKFIRSSAQSDSARALVILYGGRATVTYPVAGNLWRIADMRRNWWTSFTKSIWGSLNSDLTWRSGIGCFYKVFLHSYILTFLWILGKYKWCQDEFLPPTTGDGVSLWTESTMRLLIGYWSVLGLIRSFRDIPNRLCFFSCSFSCLYRYMAALGVSF